MNTRSPRTLLTSGVLACALFSAASVLSAAQPAPQASAPQGGGPGLISTPIFPLAEVHPGLHGTGYSVFEGSKPEAFGVVVLGVLRDAIGPGKDMILVRLEGSRMEFTGVAAGMSGSPVYIDGRLLGAIGFRIGQFTKEPIAGVTPIQQMLHVISASTTKSGHSSGSQMVSTDPSNATLPQPISTPLVFDGFSPAAIKLFQQHLSGAAVSSVSTLGSASPRQLDPAPIVPGSAISALIVSGDFNMAATCTVTYVDPKRLLACGHPITRFGGISLPMAKAQVVTTLASSLSPMKVVNTTQVVGSFTQDRESGVMGVFGRTAAMIPVAMEFSGVGEPRTYHFGIADHPKLTSVALLSTVFQAMQDTNSYDDPATYHLQGTISVEHYPAVHLDEWIAPAGAQPSSLLAAITVAQRFDALFSNPRELPAISAVTLDFDSTAGNRSAELTSARVLSPRIRAGDRVTVEAALHPFRKPEKLVRMQVQLPATLAPGPVRLLISDGATLDHTLHLIANPTAPPEGLAETVKRLNELHPSDRLYVTLLAPVPQATVGASTLPAVPLSMANVLQPESGASTITLDGETALPLGSQAFGEVLTGSQVITLDVRP